MHESPHQSREQPRWIPLMGSQNYWLVCGSLSKSTAIASWNCKAWERFSQNLQRLSLARVATKILRSLSIGTVLGCFLHRVWVNSKAVASSEVDVCCFQCSDECMCGKLMTAYEPVPPVLVFLCFKFPAFVQSVRRVVLQTSLAWKLQCMVRPYWVEWHHLLWSVQYCFLCCRLHLPSKGCRPKVGWSLSLLIHLEIFGVWTQVSKLQLLETPVQCNRCNLRLWLCISSKRWRTTRPEPCIVLRWDFVPFCLIQNTSCRSKSTNMCAHLGCPTFHIAPRIAPRIAPKHFSNRDWGLPLACVPTARPEIRIWCFDLVWRNKVHFLLRPLCGTWPLQNWPNSSCAAIPF